MKPASSPAGPQTIDATAEVNASGLGAKLVRQYARERDLNVPLDSVTFTIKRESDNTLRLVMTVLGRNKNNERTATQLSDETLDLWHGTLNGQTLSSDERWALDILANELPPHGVFRYALWRLMRMTEDHSVPPALEKDLDERTLLLLLGECRHTATVVRKSGLVPYTIGGEEQVGDLINEILHKRCPDILHDETKAVALRLYIFEQLGMLHGG